MRNYKFKCPKCGSSCFGTQNAHIEEKAIIVCHSSDDPRIKKLYSRGIIKNLTCDYRAKYNDKSHWVRRWR